MKLDDYLEFLDPLDIRIKGTRIGLDDVIYAFRQGLAPDEITNRYHSLTLEQVYATLAYYLHYRSQVDNYMTRLETWREERRRAMQSAPTPPVVHRLRMIKESSQQEYAEPQTQAKP